MCFAVVICGWVGHLIGTLASGAGCAVVGYELAPAIPNGLMTNARHLKDPLRVRSAEDDTATFGRL